MESDRKVNDISKIKFTCDSNHVNFHLNQTFIGTPHWLDELCHVRVHAVLVLGIFAETSILVLYSDEQNRLSNHIYAAL